MMISERKLRPLRDIVVVRPDADRDKKHVLIHIPDRYQAKTANDRKTIFKLSDQYTIGTVEAVGPGLRRTDSKGRTKPERNPVDLKVGDRIVYKRAEASMVGDRDARVFVHERSVVGTVADERSEQSAIGGSA